MSNQVMNSDQRALLVIESILHHASISRVRILPFTTLFNVYFASDDFRFGHSKISKIFESITVFKNEEEYDVNAAMIQEALLVDTYEKYKTKFRHNVNEIECNEKRLDQFYDIRDTIMQYISDSISITPSLEGFASYENGDDMEISIPDVIHPTLASLDSKLKHREVWESKLLEINKKRNDTRIATNLAKLAQSKSEPYDLSSITDSEKARLFSESKKTTAAKIDKMIVSSNETKRNKGLKLYHISKLPQVNEYNTGRIRGHGRNVLRRVPHY